MDKRSMPGYEAPCAESIELKIEIPLLSGVEGELPEVPDEEG